MPADTDSHDDIWRDLAIAAQGGDKAAYNRLLREISAYMRKALLPGLSSPDDAEDIVQEALVSIHKSMHSYRPDRPFRPWLHAIMNFRRADYLRKHYATRQDKTTGLEEYHFDVTKPAHSGELKDIEAALGTLPDKQRQIFEMMKIQGYTAQEVASKMEMNVPAVKVSAHRAMKKLQTKLK